MKRIICLLVAMLAFEVAHSNVQTGQMGSSLLADARSQMELFRRKASGGRPDASAYEALSQACKQYMEAIDRTAFGSAEYNECRQALMEIFPQLADGAYYFASLNNQEKVLDYACEYVDVSLMKCMDSGQLQRSPQYATLANLAATNLYNRRQYDRSIKYFSAYLESGDPTAQENAFEGLARCYFETGQFGFAGSICYQGTQRYPRNMNMLLIGIESCGHNGNDAEMEGMLQKALALQPDHRGLLEYQGKMYERMNRYEEAAATYSRLCALQPGNLDYTCHLGFDYYNAATLAYSRAAGGSGGVDNSARLFGLAVPHLRAVLDNSPYAANVARALAFCYSRTNNSVKLQEANKTLASLHSPAVDIKALPTLVNNYTPSPELSPVTASATVAIANGDDSRMSDVDINIPETGLKRPDTHVVIIANENYSNAEVQSVPFAHRDGFVFGEYCQKVLGVPKENITLVKDASAARMRQEVKHLYELTDIKPDKLSIIFYYAGHGNPDIPNNRSYLVPVDVRANEFEECYALDNLYAQFDGMKAKNVTVFLDACFSGATRSGQMMMSGRYVRKHQADVKPAGKTVVFSASSGDEAANAYNEQKHGYFTYYLLKALQETRGNITYSELRDRLAEEVRMKAQILERKQQTPSFACPDALLTSMSTRRLTD